MRTRGALIVFEGCDRSGKTTQTARCTQALLSQKTPLAPDSPWRFPDRTTAIGQTINSYLQNKLQLPSLQAIHLLFSANRWEKYEMMLKALENGQTVVLDRYAYSGLVYSVAKGLNREWCKNSDRGLIEPDVVIFLDLEWSVLGRRKGFGEEKFEEKEMQIKVKEGFKELVDEKWRIVDGGREVEVVHKEVMEIVWETLRKVEKGEPLRKLWQED